MKKLSLLLITACASIPESVERTLMKYEECHFNDEWADEALADLRRWQKDGPEPRKDL